MTDLHAEYAAAVRRNLYDLGCNWDVWLPRLIAEWESIDDHHRATDADTEPRAPTDAELAAWIEAHPKEFADWAAKQARTAGTGGPRTGQAAPRRRRTT